MTLRLYPVNVRNGDCTLIELDDGGPSTLVLIDGGLDRTQALDFLKRHRVRHLDLVVASHIDYDHVNGLRAVFDAPDMTIDELWITDIYLFRDFITEGLIRHQRYPSHALFSLVASNEILKSGSVRDVRCRAVYNGHSKVLGNLRIDVIYPPPSVTEFLTSAPNLLRVFKGRSIPREWTAAGGLTVEEVRERGWVEERVSNAAVATGVERLNLPDLLREHDYAMPELGEEPPEFDDQSYFESQHLINDTSIVLKLTYGNHTLLFPGDLTNWSYIMASHPQDVQGITFLKAPHHGSYIRESRRPPSSREALRDILLSWPLNPRWWKYADPDDIDRLVDYVWGWDRPPRQSALLYAILRPELVLVFPREQRPSLPYRLTREFLQGVARQILCTRNPREAVDVAASCLRTFDCTLAGSVAPIEFEISQPVRVPNRAVCAAYAGRKQHP